MLRHSAGDGRINTPCTMVVIPAGINHNEWHVFSPYRRPHACGVPLRPASPSALISVIVTQTTGVIPVRCSRSGLGRRRCRDMQSGSLPVPTALCQQLSFLLRRRRGVATGRRCDAPDHALRPLAAWRSSHPTQRQDGRLTQPALSSSVRVFHAFGLWLAVYGPQCNPVVDVGCYRFRFD